MKRFGDGRDWFFQQRFGLFVHWGLYSIPGWHEQILWRRNTNRDEYEKLVTAFNPTRFNPDDWLDVAESAGMEYLCFTTKHHDGFCMWDTAHTDYKVTNTPFGQDVLAMLAEACRRRGFRLCLYYSLPDWHHKHYPNYGRHHEMFGPRPGDAPDESKYLDYVRNQVHELVTGYGPIGAFFWDVNVAGFRDESLNDLIRAHQPEALINDRGPGKGDYSTPERHIPDGCEFLTPTEACQSMGRESWGYREDEDYFTDRFLIQSIDRIMAMGGNYLLNVGPKPDGALPEQCVAALRRIGGWMGRVREGLYGAIPNTSILRETKSDYCKYDDILLTRKGNSLYVHTSQGLQSPGVVLPGIDRPPKSAVLLNDLREVHWTVDTLPGRWNELPALRLKNLPVHEFPDEVLVVRLEY